MKSRLPLFCYRVERYDMQASIYQILFNQQYLSSCDLDSLSISMFANVVMHNIKKKFNIFTQIIA